MWVLVASCRRSTWCENEDSHFAGKHFRTVFVGHSRSFGSIVAVGESGVEQGEPFSCLPTLRLEEALFNETAGCRQSIRAVGGGVGGTWAAPSPQQAVLLFTATKQPSALKGPSCSPLPQVGNLGICGVHGLNSWSKVASWRFPKVRILNQGPCCEWMNFMAGRVHELGVAKTYIFISLAFNWNWVFPSIWMWAAHQWRSQLLGKWPVFLHHITVVADMLKFELLLIIILKLWSLLDQQLYLLV